MTPAEEEKNAELLHRLVQTRAGSAVERCHGVRHARSYSNAMHQWGVAALLYQLWPGDFGRLGAHCLFHDTAEAWVGDIPAPTMRWVPGLRETIGKIEGGLCARYGLPREDSLNAEDHAKMKACDRLELWFWCQEELAAGNRFVWEFVVELGQYLDTAPMPEPAGSLYKFIRDKSFDAYLPIQAGVMSGIGGNTAAEGAKVP
jgi:hypothetical protein